MTGHTPRKLPFFRRNLPHHRSARAECPYTRSIMIPLSRVFVKCNFRKNHKKFNVFSSLSQNLFEAVCSAYPGICVIPTERSERRDLRTFSALSRHASAKILRFRFAPFRMTRSLGRCGSECRDAPSGHRLRSVQTIPPPLKRSPSLYTREVFEKRIATGGKTALAMTRVGRDV